VAQWHSQSDPSIKTRLTYKVSTVEQLCSVDATEGFVRQFDGVVASEIVEHVSDAELFVNSCCSLVKVSFSTD